jgi:mono/diheme cytochrome c family protein
MMLITVKAEPTDQYRTWVDRQAQLNQAANATLGEQQFEGVCAKCHYLTMSGPTLVGPNIGGNPTLTDPQALQKLLRNGQNAMPAVGKGWTDAQINSISKYVEQESKSGG